MNSTTFKILWAIFVVLFFLYLSLRVNSRRTRNAPWLRGHFAHRGLYRKDQSTPENSLAAFARSLNYGFGIELDVQISADGKVYVFHDDDLQRMTGVQGLLEHKTSLELDELRLQKTEEKIPLLSEVLDLVSGKVPLLVELKTTKRKEECVKAVVEVMKGYNGHYAYCSFDPLLLMYLKIFAKGILRGLNMEYAMDKKELKWLTRVALQYGLLNDMGRPDYLSVNYMQVPFVYRLWHAFGAYGMKWAVPSQESEDSLRGSCETIIFEQYLPRENIDEKAY